MQPLARGRWNGAARSRRESQVASVIGRAPRADAEVLPVTPDDDAVVKVAHAPLPPPPHTDGLAGIALMGAIPHLWVDLGVDVVAEVWGYLPSCKRAWNWLSLMEKLDIGSLSRL
jgi:hypothetical protein